MPKRLSKRTAESILYARCYLFTLGVVLAGVAAYVGQLQGGAARSSPGWAVVVSLALGGMAVYSLVAALLAPAKAVESQADALSSHEAALAVMLLAVPVYGLIRRLARAER